MTRLIILSMLVGAALVGVLLASYQPAQSGTRYRVYIYPSDGGSQGQLAHLHCKIHGACGASTGNGLDWDSWTNPSNRNGNFRVYNANLFSGAPAIRGDRSANFRDTGNCDYMQIRIFDPGLGVYKGTVIYYHTRTSSPSTSFTIPLAWSSTYATAMVGDSDCTSGGRPAWGGFHIHEKSSGHQYLNPDIRFNGGTYGDYCNPTHTSSDNCLKLTNNSLVNYSRYFDW